MARGKAKNPENDKRAKTSKKNIKKATEEEEEYENCEELDKLLILLLGNIYLNYKKILYTNILYGKGKSKEPRE